MLLTTATAGAETAETYYVDASGTHHSVTAIVLTGSETSLAAGWYVAKGTLNFTNSYYTAVLGTAQGTAPFIYTTKPDGIGTEGTTYSISGITPYDNGIGYDGKYYTAPPATHSLTANLADGNYWPTFYCGDADYQIATENACAYTATASGTTVTLTKRGADIPTPCTK